MASSDTARADFERITALCREAEALLPAECPRRIEVLLRMLLLELDQYRAREGETELVEA